MKRFLGDIPVELSKDAPRDKIVMHREVFFELERRGLASTAEVNVLISDEDCLPRFFPES